MSEESEFPNVDRDVHEAAQYASLWAYKELTQVTEKKMLWVLFEMDLHRVINQRPQLSPSLFQ